jgi:hypothetical protein
VRVEVSRFTEDPRVERHSDEINDLRKMLDSLAAAAGFEFQPLAGELRAVKVKLVAEWKANANKRRHKG